MRYWSDKTGLPATRLTCWIGIPRSTYYDWRSRYGKVNEHNSWIPRDTWLEEWERRAIVKYHMEHPLEGYRRLTYMMMDEGIVAVSPSSVYRVLKREGLLSRWNRSGSKKGRGFDQPTEAHEHWHTDITQIKVFGTYYFLCSVLDGYSRYVVHWELRESMQERDVEIITQRAHERFPGARPRLISDNGSQFVAKDFKEFIRVSGMTHVRTRPYYPQSNGKIERYHKSLKAECIRRKTPLSFEDTVRIVTDFVRQYNEQRLHSAIGYITPTDKLEGRSEQIWAERDAKLAAARAERKAVRRRRRMTYTQSSGAGTPPSPEGWGGVPQTERTENSLTVFAV